MSMPTLISREPSRPPATRGLFEIRAEPPSRDTEFDFDVAIVGLGYVGLPTALAFFSAGQRVLGVDVSERRLAVINDGHPDLLDTDADTAVIGTG